MKYAFLIFLALSTTGFAEQAPNPVQLAKDAAAEDAAAIATAIQNAQTSLDGIVPGMRDDAAAYEAQLKAANGTSGTYEKASLDYAGDFQKKYSKEMSCDDPNLSGPCVDQATPH